MNDKFIEVEEFDKDEEGTIEIINKKKIPHKKNSSLSKRIILFSSIIFATIIILNRNTLSKYAINFLNNTILKNPFNDSEHYDYDLIIVGAGLAGLSAAFEANKLFKGKKKILILEKNPRFGGDSAKATSGINILNSPLQEKEDLKDSFDLFYDDTMASGKYLSIPELVSTLVNDSHYLFDFYTKEIKADLSQIAILGGHSIPRTVRPTKETVGYHLVSSTFNTLKNLSSVKFIYNATVKELLTDEKKNYITGLKYILNENKTNIIKLTSKAIILATGGFGHDFDTHDSLLKEFAPKLVHFPTTNGIQTQGIGVKIGRKIGIKLYGMEHIQLHPTGLVNLNDRYNYIKILGPELLRGVGGILVNQKGERFCNELGTRDYVTKKIIENCELAKTDVIKQFESFLLINQKSIDNYGGKINFYIQKGYLQKYNSFKELVEKYNISNSYDNLIKTINEYNEACDTKNDKFGKRTFPQKFDLNDYIYGGIITPSIHYTMGGLLMDKNGELIKEDGTIMKGLYGAGEVTGGVHGGNRLGGNSLMECGVFGRRAAQAAVEYVYKFDK